MDSYIRKKRFDSYMSVKIIVDSTSYIPQSFIDELGIDVIPLSVAFGEEIFNECDISNEAFFEKLDNSKEMPKSSQPSVDTTYRAFERQIKAGHEVIGVFISSEMSGSYKTANIVKEMLLEEYPEAVIGLVDSQTTAMVLGFAAIIGARAAQSGVGFDEVMTQLETYKRRNRFLFLPETLEYLKKGGRIGSAKALFGTMLKIKPVLMVKDGKTEALGSVRTKKKAVKQIMNVCVRDMKAYGVGDLVVHHINCPEEAIELASVLANELGLDQVTTCPIGPVVGTHVGPGAIGIAYYTQEDLGEAIL